MADDVTILDASGARVIVSAEEITTLNGSSVAAREIQRVMLATVSGTAATDIGGTNPVPVSVAADPFGAIADALVAAGATGSISAKLRRATQGLEDLKSLIVLAAGTNEIGGVNQTRVAGTAVDVSSGNKSAGTQRVVLATDQPQLANAWKVDGSAVTQPVSGTVGLVAQTSGGWTPSKTISASGTNATAVKRSAGQLGSYGVSNNSTSKRYVKLYDKASAPTVGTDTPVWTIELQPGALANVEFTQGLAFANGIAFAITTGIADSDTGAVGANEVIVNLGFK